MSLLKRWFGGGPGNGTAPGTAATRDAAPAPLPLSAQDLVSATAAQVAAGRFGDALARLDGALETTPADPALWFARGSTLSAWGRVREARAAFLQAEACGGNDAGLELQLGVALLQTGAPADAQARLQRALGAGAARGLVHAALAAALRQQQRAGDAVQCLQQALRSDPDDVRCLLGLGNLALDRGDPVAAEAAFRRAVEAANGDAIAWVHLAVALDQQNRAAEGLAACERAVERETPADRDADIFVTHAVLLHRMGRTREAVDLCEQELPERPSVHGYRTYAGMLLAVGRLEDAWQYYDFRWLAEPQVSLRPAFGRPCWAGQDLRGRSILLHVEQGFGDILQYVRYAPLVKALGPTVLLVAPRALTGLARTVRGVDRVLGPGDEAPEFDYVVHLMTLPKIFGTRLATIPAAVPYLAPDPERRRLAQAEVAREAGDALKVGLVWSGSAANAYNARRACPLAALAPLFALPGVRWFSLQRSGETLVTDGAAAVPLVLLPMRDDMDGTAALVDALDLVLCVDTAIAHLAGALGKPTWLMLPEAPHWTWLEDRDDSPWYPTMRLFRQKACGDWSEVADRVRAALAALIRKPDEVLPPEFLPVAAAAVPALAPMTAPGPGPGHRSGMSAVAETRHGILQHRPDDGDESLSLGWYGEWLEAQVRVLARLLQRDATVLEVGAGVGGSAVWLGKALDATGHLVLCEPRPVHQRILRENLVANRVANATLLHGVLGRPGAENETVDALRLPKLDWIKVDLAQHSAEVLAGAAETLWRLRPRLFLAASDAQAVADLADVAKAHGYRCWRHESALFSATNFNRREDDVFGGRMAWALLGIPEEADAEVALPDCVALS